MAAIDRFKALQSKSERKCTYAAQYLQLRLKMPILFLIVIFDPVRHVFDTMFFLLTLLNASIFFLFLPPACIFFLIVPASTAASNTFPCLLRFCFANAS